MWEGEGSGHGVAWDRGTGAAGCALSATSRGTLFLQGGPGLSALRDRPVHSTLAGDFEIRFLAI